MTDPAHTAGADAPAVSGSGDPFARTDPPLYEITLWPHRSMTRRGFRWFIGALAAGLSIPLLAAWGTPVVAVLAPFLIGALALVCWMVRLHDRRRARQGERLRLWPDALAVEHVTEKGRVLRWSANPYWVQVELGDTRRRENDLILRGGGRAIELGGFLSPDERSALAAELRRRLAEAGRRS